MLARTIRPPAVAGQFYPDDPEILTRDLDEYLRPASEAADKLESALGCVVPHAGYVFSGAVAGAVYQKLPDRSSYVILGPNHFGLGEPLAIISAGSWLTPLGEVAIDTPLAQALRHSYHLLMEDSSAHAKEHSLEVQLPFLQREVKSFRFVPIAVWQSGYAMLETLGHCIANALKGLPQRPLIVASSDMNHYEPDSITRVKDRMAIDRMLELDPKGLYQVIRKEDISMCGYGPTIAMLTAAADLGAKKAELVKYATSADARVSGAGRSKVVGYAGIIVS
jgi:AmmeMemoRadiSam system protein B